MLTVSDIETSYGRSQVLFGISLEVRESEVVTLLGRNGMGKTTTVRSIMGLTPISGGRTHFAYECIADVAGIWNVLGVIFRPLVKMQLRGFMRKLMELAEAEAGPTTVPA